MLILRQSSLNHFDKPTAVTIGAFDGVHRGHQQMIKQLTQIAKKNNLTPVVICFEPQPKEFFLKEKAPKRLTTFRDRVRLFKEFGIDTLLCLRFNQKLKDLTAEAFIKEILVSGLNAKHILIGDDFHFGKDQKGNIQLLEQLASFYHFHVDKIPSYYHKNQRISSSIIRKLISEGDFNQANDYLGYPYRISGTVHHGDKNGRKLGFSTMNIPLKRPMIISGVYIVNVLLEHKNYYGVANIGTRPTFQGLKYLLEVHLFNFDQSVYHKNIQVAFLHWLRNEVKFASLDDLKTQIALDIKQAKQWLCTNQINQTPCKLTN